MYCKNCGQQLPDEAIYCEKCGERQSSKSNKKNDKFITQLIYNRSGVDVFSNEKTTIDELYNICEANIEDKYKKNLGKINSGESLWTFQYSKGAFSFLKDDNILRLVSLGKKYLLDNNWDDKSSATGANTSDYKAIFTKKK
jgi:hypothetical protein